MQWGSRLAALPPWTLGLRPHPSPALPGEGGWPGGQGRAMAGLRRRRGRLGLGGGWGEVSERKTPGQPSAPKKPAIPSPRLVGS